MKKSEGFFRDTNIKATIFLGIITTILCVYCIEPLIDMAKNYTGNIYTSYINYIYRCASIYDGNSQLAFIISLYYLSIFNYILLQLIHSIKEYKEERDIFKESDDIIKVANDTLESLHEAVEGEEDTNNKSELVESFDSDNSIENFSERLEATKKKRSKYYKKFLTISIIALTLILFVMLNQLFPSIIKHKFEINIIKITPFVEQKEIDLLRSEWVRINEKDDFITINEKIKIIIDENSLN